MADLLIGAQEYRLIQPEWLKPAPPEWLTEVMRLPGVENSPAFFYETGEALYVVMENGIILKRLGETWHCLSRGGIMSVSEGDRPSREHWERIIGQAVIRSVERSSGYAISDCDLPVLFEQVHRAVDAWARMGVYTHGNDGARGATLATS